MTYIYAFTNIIGISIMASSLVPVGYRITTMVRSSLLPFPFSSSSVPPSSPSHLSASFLQTAILPTAVQAACHIL